METNRLHRIARGQRARAAWDLLAPLAFAGITVSGLALYATPAGDVAPPRAASAPAAAAVTPAEPRCPEPTVGAPGSTRPECIL